MKRILRELRGRGWTIRRSSGHYVADAALSGEEDAVAKVIAEGKCVAYYMKEDPR